MDDDGATNGIRSGEARPGWVRVSLWRVHQRRTAWAFVWLCGLLTFFFGGTLGPILVLAAAAYLAAIVWMDQHDAWPEPLGAPPGLSLPAWTCLVSLLALEYLVSGTAPSEIALVALLVGLVSGVITWRGWRPAQITSPRRVRAGPEIQQFGAFVVLLLIIWGGWFVLLWIAYALYPPAPPCSFIPGAALFELARLIACAVPPCVVGVIVTRRLLRDIGQTSSAQVVIASALGLSALPFPILWFLSVACV
jgi:hypothetical protein